MALLGFGTFILSQWFFYFFIWIFSETFICKMPKVHYETNFFSDENETNKTIFPFLLLRNVLIALKILDVICKHGF